MQMDHPDPLQTPPGWDVTATRQKLEKWLRSDEQTLTIFKVIQPDGGSCYGRANDFVPKAFGVSPYAMSTDSRGNVSLNAVKGILERKAKEGKPAIINLAATGQFAGATTSVFGNLGHYLLLLEVGSVIIGNVATQFGVVFDPDVSATPASRKAWGACDVTKSDYEKAPANWKVIETMILGTGNSLGPLIRYYYVS
jgi:hypothetical protein